MSIGLTFAESLEPLLELDAWLEPYRRIWAQRLDALAALSLDR